MSILPGSSTAHHVVAMQFDVAQSSRRARGSRVIGCGVLSVEAAQGGKIGTVPYPSLPRWRGDIPSVPVLLASGCRSGGNKVDMGWRICFLGIGIRLSSAPFRPFGAHCGNAAACDGEKLGSECWFTGSLRDVAIRQTNMLVYVSKKADERRQRFVEVLQRDLEKKCYMMMTVSNSQIVPRACAL